MDIQFGNKFCLIFVMTLMIEQIPGMMLHAKVV